MNALQKPDYGIDAPKVLRNLLLFGVLGLVLGIFGPRLVQLGPARMLPRPMFLGTGSLLLLEGFLYLFYVKVGKLYHRDHLLSLHSWRGDENVLDVGCGRGLLLAGAAKRMAQLSGNGTVTGVDIWSREDMSGNSEQATRRNLELEGVSDRCKLIGVAAQDLPFEDGTFDVVVSNLCLHNIYDRDARKRALRQIARVLKPGGQALISDYKLTKEYADELQRAGLSTKRVWGNPLYTFPPLRIVVARKVGA
ncbi:MAG: class I SAM-dependent methyltransferase [Candidatus Korobacteraceae bacterium]